MNLIEHYNNFVNRAEGSGLDANCRSLYFAILTAFNRNGFPSQLRLNNDYLLQQSGIKDRFSLNRAKTKLIACEIISVHANVYSLRTSSAQDQHKTDTPY